MHTHARTRTHYIFNMAIIVWVVGGVGVEWCGCGGWVVLGGVGWMDVRVVKLILVIETEVIDI